MKSNKFGISNNSWLLLLKAIKSYPQVERAVIFGSRAKGNYKKGSDIDIAIYGNEVDIKTALDLCGTLNEELPTPYYYDVVAVEKIDNSDLIEHIERVGKTFYDKEKGLPKGNQIGSQCLLV